jgi:hypothetical protein
MPALLNLKAARPTAPGALGPVSALAALLALAALGGFSAHANEQADRAGRRGADQAAPLASLAAPAGSYTWDLAFWSTHQTARTPLWRAALAFCIDKREAAFPACTAVRLASWWRPAGSDLPEASAGGSDLPGAPPRLNPPAAPRTVPAIAAAPPAGHGKSAGRTSGAAEPRP